MHFFTLKMHYCTFLVYICVMAWENNLKFLVKKCLNTSTAIPEKSVLNKAHCSLRRFQQLKANKVKMNAIELIVFADWLKIEPKELINL